MKFAVSLGVFSEFGNPLSTLISEMADLGFDMVSISPQMILQLDSAKQRDILDCLKEHALTVAMHTEFTIPFEELRAAVDLLGSHLSDITFDSILRWTSAGFLFDMRCIIPYLQKVDELARQHGFLYGVEDFPEDTWALRMYREDLSPLLKSPHFGILVDVGHLNLSMHKYGYIDVAVEQYISDLPVPLIEVHLSDNDGEEDQHLPLGIGNVDFAAVARGLKRVGFSGITTIEIEQAHQANTIDVKGQVEESLFYWRHLLEKD
jgi:sugar phosphate isomerase/epimerase